MFLGLSDLDWITRIFCSFSTFTERERETGGGVECLRLFCVRVSKEGSFEEEEEEEGEISWSLGSLLWAHTRFFSCLSDIGVNCVLYVVLLCHLGII